MTFDEAVAAYQESAAAMGLPTTRLQAESQVESLRDWSETGGLDGLREWFLAQRAANPMRVSKIAMDDCRVATVGAVRMVVVGKGFAIGHA